MSFEERLENLHELLRCAMMVELTTIPAYLTAGLSLDDTEPSGGARNAAAQELIRSVVVEEMLHMVLVGNILAAVGGEARLDRPEWVPRYPARLFPDRARGLTLAGETIGGSRPLIVHLRRFEPRQIEAFLEIEGPARGPTEIGGDLALRGIGQFYGALADELRDMAETFGEARLFAGDPAHQIGPDAYYAAAGEVVVVDAGARGGALAAALAAIRKIAEEGEGLDEGHEIFDGDVIPGGLGEEPAHYFRFREILAGRRYRPGARWGDPPDGEAVEVDWEAVWPAIEDPDPDDPALPVEIAETMRAFDRRYTGLLRALNRAFNGAPEELGAAVNAMFTLRHAAVGLMRTPIGDGRTAAPSWRFANGEV